jgi:hypothetical protein
MRIEGKLAVQHARRVDLLAVFTSTHISSQNFPSANFGCTLKLCEKGQRRVSLLSIKRLMTAQIMA